MRFGPRTTTAQDSYDARTGAAVRRNARETWRFGSFGARLRALREAAGFPPEELARVVGLSVQTTKTQVVVSGASFVPGSRIVPPRLEYSGEGS